jgi:hypothetical protein
VIKDGARYKMRFCSRGERTRIRLGAGYGREGFGLAVWE